MGIVGRIRTLDLLIEAHVNMIKKYLFLCNINLVFQFHNYWTKIKKVRILRYLRIRETSKKEPLVIFLQKYMFFYHRAQYGSKFEIFSKNKLFPFC